MGKPYWTTKNGDDILYKDLTDSHLLNILSFIIRRADEGVFFGGGGWDIEDMWCDTVYGEDVLNMLDYNGIKKEAIKRKLIDKE